MKCAALFLRTFCSCSFHSGYTNVILRWKGRTAGQHGDAQKEGKPVPMKGMKLLPHLTLQKL